MAAKFNETQEGFGTGADKSLESMVAAHAKIMSDTKKLNEFIKKDNLNSQIETNNARLKNEKLTADQRSQIVKQNEDLQKQIQERAVRATLKWKENQYKKATLSEKASMKRTEADNIATKRKSLQEQMDAEIEAAEASGASEEQIHAIKQKYHKETLDLINEERDARQKADDLEKEDKKQSNKVASGLRKLQGGVGGLEASAKAAGEKKEAAQKNLDNAKSEIEELQKVLSDDNATDEEKEMAKQQMEAARQNLAAARNQVNAAAVQESAAKAAAKAFAQMYKDFDEVVAFAKNYKGAIESRLQGSEKSYNDVLGMISTNLAVNPYVETKKVIEAVKAASEKGIVYNVEQRAFLSELSNKIADTFDAFDSNLLRLIRLQQSDSTAARLGMEASMTKLLNRMFEDNSYMSDSAGYDAVSAALLDASASMTKEAATAFEFTAQKWLGALYSLGLSSDTVGTIAEGLNYIATGDVTSLASNSSLQTLFTMAASNAGLNYADLLTDGLDASNTNKLMESMVAYLKSIAENSDNQVVRSAYGDIFNVSISDMRAIANMTSDEIKTLSSATLDYTSMMQELNNQMSMSNMMSRTTLGAMMDTIYENVVYSVSEDLANNPITHSMVKMLQYMQSTDLDIAIPFVNAAGFGLDLNTSVQDILNLGVGLSSAVSLATNIISSISNGGGLDLDSWNAAEYTSRGGDISFTTSSAAGETTNTTYMSNYNSDDMTKSSLNSATDDAEETKEITNKNTKTDFTLEDLYTALIEGTDGNQYARVQERVLGLTLNSTSDYLHAVDARMKFDGHDLRVADSQLSFDGVRLRVLSTVSGDYVKGDHIQVRDTTMGLLSSAITSIADKATAQKVTLSETDMNSIANKVAAAMMTSLSTDNNKVLETKSVLDKLYTFLDSKSDGDALRVSDPSVVSALSVLGE